MKFIANLFRILLGLVFIGSGFVKGIDPLGSEYKFIEYFLNSLFTFKFTFSINTYRTNFIIFNPWSVIFAIENIICTDMD